MFNTIRQLFRLTFSKDIRPQPCRTFYYWLEGRSSGEIRAKDIDDAVDSILKHLADRGKLPFGLVSILIILDMANATLREVTVTTPTFSLSLPKAHRVEKVNRHG